MSNAAKHEFKQKQNTSIRARLSHRRKAILSTMLSRWLDKRIPPASQHSLTLNSIFVLPTGFGWSFIIMALCLFLLGTNYQNNLMVLLSYILLSVMLLTLFYTHQNFARLAVKSQPIAPFHCHQTGKFQLVVIKHYAQQDKPCKGNLVARWLDTKEHVSFILNAEEKSQQRLSVPIKRSKRGKYSLPRLTLACDFPLGLFKCWTHLDFDADILVYPKPLQDEAIQVALPFDESEQSKNDTTTSSHSSTDFHSLSDYKAGEPLNRVVWKQVAKSGDWVVKQFSDPINEKYYLSVDNQIDVERAISILTHHVIEQSKNGNQFGLQYRSIDISPHYGDSHTHQCLKALSLLNLPQRTYPNDTFSAEAASS